MNSHGKSAARQLNITGHAFPKQDFGLHLVGVGRRTERIFAFNLDPNVVVFDFHLDGITDCHPGEVIATGCDIGEIIQLRNEAETISSSLKFEEFRCAVRSFVTSECFQRAA